VQTRLEGLNLGEVPVFALAAAVFVVVHVLIRVHYLNGLLLVFGLQLVHVAGVKSLRGGLRQEKGRPEIFVCLSANVQQVQQAERLLGLRLVRLLSHGLVVFEVRGSPLVLAHFHFGGDLE